VPKFYFCFLTYNIILRGRCKVLEISEAEGKYNLNISKSQSKFWKATMAVQITMIGLGQVGGSIGLALGAIPILSDAALGNRDNVVRMLDGYIESLRGLRGNIQNLDNLAVGRQTRSAYQEGYAWLAVTASGEVFPHQ
jgi:hypothetical protein